MRVLLVSADRNGLKEPVFPLGPAYIASALRREGVEARIFDAGAHPFPLRPLRLAIRAFLPEVVGLSLRHVDRAAYPRARCSLPEYAGVACEVRGTSTARLFLGGSAFSLFPDDLMRLLKADGGATGDGEDGMLRFLRGEGGPIQRGRLENLDGVGIPRDAETFLQGFDPYPVVGIQTMRGCAQSCIHCVEPLLEGAALRPRNPEAVAEELEFLFREHGKRNFFFVDTAFNADEGHMARVCRAILSRNIPIRFSCYLRPKIDDPSLFGLLAGAGCVSVEFGTDSGSDRILSSLRKGFTADDVRAASDACRRARIGFLHALVFGGPGENPETVRETVRLMDEAAPAAVVARTGLRIYPRTKLYQIALREGMLSPDDSLLGPRHYFPRNDSYWLLREVREAAGRRRNWFFPGRPDWKKALRTRILRPFHPGEPAWKAFRHP